jgi:hypothetical protein
MADAERGHAESESAYLSSPDGDAAERITAMKWARYLGAAFGPSGALSALRYYAEIGWIGEDVRRTMVDYVRGLTIEELELAELEPDLHGSLENLEGTEFERHARSLQFVAAISGRSIEHGLASLQLAESIGQRPLSGVSGAGASAAGQPASMGPGGGPFGGSGMEPGQQAELAASRREQDRKRRDERAAASDSAASRNPGADETPDEASTDDIGIDTDRSDPRANDDATDRSTEASETDQRSEAAAADRRSEVDEVDDDVDVSMADVTPGSEGGFDVEETDGGSPTDEESADDDLAVGDETVPTGDPDTDEPGGDPTTPDPEPSPAPSPSDPSGVEGLDATFEDGAVEPADEDERVDSETNEQAPSDADRCVAETRDGDRCSLPATDGDYCHQHAPDDE